MLIPQIIQTTTLILRSGTDFLWTDSTEAGNENSRGVGYYDREINQDIIQEIIIGDSALEYVFGDGTTVRGDGTIIEQEITIQQPVYAFDAFNDYANEPENLSQDDYTTSIGPNFVVLEGPDADGYFTVQQDITQTIDQDIIQDVYYEVAIVQDMILIQDINQTYTADIIKTETRTRLVGD